MGKELNYYILEKAINFTKTINSITSKEELETCVYMVYKAIEWGIEKDRLKKLG